MKKFRKLDDGELSPVTRRRKDGTYAQLIRCCDCGLTHAMLFELTAKGSLRFRAWRLPRK